MKLNVIFYCLCFILCLTQTNNLGCKTVFASEDVFYRVYADETYFCQNPSLNSAMFKLEKTYFVKFLSNTENGFIKAEYNGILGYVLLNNLTKINGTPENPYPIATFDMNGSANAVLFSQPNNNSTFLGTIPFNATNTVYYGQIEGQEMLQSMGSTWYYCKYTSYEQGIVYGYVYAPLTKNLTNIQPNTETFPDSDTTEASANPIEKIIAPEIRDSNNLFIIISLLIFTLLIVYLALKNIKRKSKKTKASKQYIDKVQNNYIEFNEKDDF